MATVALGGMTNSAMLKTPDKQHAADEELALADADGDSRGEGNADEQCGKAESIEPGEEIHVAGNESEVGQHDVAAHHDGCEVKQGGEEQHDPGTILEEVRQVLAERRFSAAGSGWMRSLVAKKATMKKMTLRADSRPMVNW